MTRVWKYEDIEILQNEVKGFAHQFKVLLAEVNVVVNWISQRFGENLIDREATVYKSICDLEEIAAISAQLSSSRDNSFAADTDAISIIDEQEVMMPGLSALDHDDSSQDPLADTDTEVNACNEDIIITKTESCAVIPEKIKHKHQHKLRLKPKVKKTGFKKVKTSRHDKSVRKSKRQVIAPSIKPNSPAETKDICRVQLTRLEHDNSVAASIRSLQNSRNETVIKTATKTKITKDPKQSTSTEQASSSSPGEDGEVEVPKRGRPKKLPEERVRTYDPRVPMQCDECGKVLKGAGALRVHKQIHQNVRPYNCTTCGRAFRRKHHLEFHMMIHVGTKNEKCRFCGKAFLIYRDLARHERTHTGEKPFSCHLCPKSFNVKQHLTLHIRTHTGERPYRCPICDKTFTQANSLRIHKKIHLRDKEKAGGNTSGGANVTGIGEVTLP